MLKKLTKGQRFKLRQERDRLLDEMHDWDTDSPRYMQNLEKVERLENLLAMTPKAKFSWDAVILGGANVVGITIMVVYEHKNVIASKGMNLIKPFLRVGN